MPRESLSGIIDPAGRCRVEFRPVGQERWTVLRMSVSSSSSAETTAAVYLSEQYEMGTSTGNADTSSNDAIEVDAPGVLAVVWTGGTPGAVCNATAVYRRVGG